MVNWSAEKDQTILRGIFAFHDIKNSQPLLQYLAEEIGEGCTAKAVSHRLTNLRKSGKMVNASGGTSTPSKKMATQKAPRTPASGRGTVKAPKSKKLADNDISSGDDEPVISPSGGIKRSRASVRKSYAESDASTGDDEEEEEAFTPVKKVKTEPIEHEGIANTGTNDSFEEEEDEDAAFV